MGKTHTKLTEDEERQLRHDYEAPGANVSDLARRYGLTRGAVQDRARRNVWKKGVGIEVLGPVPQTGLAGGPAGEPAGAGEADEPPLGLTDPVRVRMLERHQKDWGPIRRLMREATKGLSRGGKIDTDKVADALDLTKVLVPMQKAEREAYLIGMDFKPPANAATSGQAVANFMKPLLERMGNDKIRIEELEQRLAKYEPIEA